MHVPPLIPESSPIRPNFKLWEWKSNVNTHSAQAKPLYKNQKNLCLGALQAWTVHFGVLLCLTIWTVAKMFEALYWPTFGVRGQGGGKHMNRVQFLELFDFIAAAFKGTTLKKRTYKKIMFCFFLGRAPKNLELVWNHLYLSICLFLFLSLALSYLSTDYILIISKMWITSITIALVSCCIGSLLDAFPVGLDKDVSGMRRSVTQQIYLKTFPLLRQDQWANKSEPCQNKKHLYKGQVPGPPLNSS